MKKNQLHPLFIKNTFLNQIPNLFPEFEKNNQHFLKSLAGILILSTLFSISGSIRWETEMESQKYTWMI